MLRAFTLRQAKWLGRVQILFSMPKSWFKSRPFWDGSIAQEKCVCRCLTWQMDLRVLSFNTTFQQQNQYFNVGLYNMSILNIGVTQHYLRLSLQIVSSFDQRSATRYSHAAAQNAISWCPRLLVICIFLERGEEQGGFARAGTQSRFFRRKIEKAVYCNCVTPVWYNCLIILPPGHPLHSGSVHFFCFQFLVDAFCLNDALCFEMLSSVRTFEETLSSIYYIYKFTPLLLQNALCNYCSVLATCWDSDVYLMCMWGYVRIWTFKSVSFVTEKKNPLWILQISLLLCMLGAF